MKVFIFAFLFVFTIFTQAQEPTPPVDPAVTDGEGSAGKTPFILYRKVFFLLTILFIFSCYHLLRRPGRQHHRSPMRFFRRGKNLYNYQFCYLKVVAYTLFVLLIHKIENPTTKNCAFICATCMMTL